MQGLVPRTRSAWRPMGLEEELELGEANRNAETFESIPDLWLLLSGKRGTNLFPSKGNKGRIEERLGHSFVRENGAG